MGFVIESANCCCGGGGNSGCCGCLLNQLFECYDHGPNVPAILDITINAACGTSTGTLVYQGSGQPNNPFNVWQGTLTLHCWHNNQAGVPICTDVSAQLSLICLNDEQGFSLEIACSGTPDTPYVVDPPGVGTLNCNPFMIHMTNAHPGAFDCCFGNVDDGNTYNEHVEIIITAPP